MTEGADLDYRTFAADDGAASAAWLRGVRMGFYEQSATEAQLAQFQRAYQADHRILTGVYDAGQGPDALAGDIPVATYATMVHTLNTGNANLLPTHQITGVTVRATHRRRGILRRLITQDLAKAKADGLAVAALTASEAVIYGRFGFGLATFLASVEVDCTSRFELRAPREGLVEMIDPNALAELSPEVFGRFHRATFGSLDRQYAYPQRAAGLWSNDKPEPDPGVRAAVYHSPDGSLDGYVSYKFDGWDSTPASMSVQDLVAATPRAHRELWRFLGSLDLVTRVKAPMASVADPLPWLLRDMRAYRTDALFDHLWLRILDTVEALQFRQWANDGVLAFTVRDPLGLADGTFRLEAEAGRARVQEHPAGSAAEVEIDAAALASLYLGGTGDIVASLVTSGSIRELRPGAALDLRRLFLAPAVPYCITGF